jgi:hypothetical protein
LLGALVDAKFLSRTRDGSFVKLDGAVPAQATKARNQKLAVA